MVRGIDSLVGAIFFVSVVGLGPFAGIRAIAINDKGVLTKLFAEAIENTDREQVKGVRATGAGRGQTIGFLLMDRMTISAWRAVSLIAIMVLVTVAGIDALSRTLGGG
ncbi:ABC transporter permease [Roseomonas sp. CECT 9278]|uniref:PhnE/PtxC family ABC transporter permease n=1 Tax=Roseomonas sp. CECT 9278 TaxID=2845823 RepID=UPI001E42141B|nr:hypothetical protein [Roseomonas sp. CECT 9278]CAH0131518.1 hypothetical protein ROS9278_00251 [Roseomonas sp. CECT 9278]